MQGLESVFHVYVNGYNALLEISKFSFVLSYFHCVVVVVVFSAKSGLLDVNFWDKSADF